MNNRTRFRHNLGNPCVFLKRVSSIPVSLSDLLTTTLFFGHQILLTSLRAMPVKKRKLSPQASSRGSATPGPSGSVATAELNGTPTSIAQPASPIGGVRIGTEDDHRLSISATPAIVPPHEERKVAKHGVIQHGSGDGLGCGDECFLWGDLPMNKHGTYSHRDIEGDGGREHIRSLMPSIRIYPS